MIIKSQLLAEELLQALQTERQSPQLVKELRGLLQRYQLVGKEENLEETEPDETVKERAEQLKAEGNARLSADDVPEAIRCYQEAIALWPTNALYHGNLSAAYLQAKQPAKAESCARASLELDPAYAKGYIRLASALAAQQRHPEAVQAMHDGLRVLPGNEQLEKHLKALQALPSSPPSSNGNASNSRTNASAQSTSLPLNNLGAMLGNPEVMRMAQQFMGSGAMADLMQGNPQLAQMLRDPSKLQDLLRTFNNNDDGNSNGNSGNGRRDPTPQ
jgi:tetratricopeptide (TPR) repeat protein